MPLHRRLLIASFTAGSLLLSSGCDGRPALSRSAGSHPVPSTDVQADSSDARRRAAASPSESNAASESSAYGDTDGARSALMAPRYEPTRGGEGYAHVPESQPVSTESATLSTFSTDVDTASYANVRRFLANGTLPPVSAVRIEEMLNYFDYDYTGPSEGEALAVRAEVGECPWNPEHRLLHIGLRARGLGEAGTPARNLVFLLDVSGSMSSPDKLELVKRGLTRLVHTLGPRDRIAIVVYAGAEGLALPPTSGADRGRILEALQTLGAGGSTNGGAGIELAYRMARRSFLEGGVNRVILASDGDFNVGVTSREELVALIEHERRDGVFLTVLGVGTGNLQDATMESLADHGNGNYAYLDSEAEAEKVLVRESSSTLVTVARDVKVQVEMNPDRVADFRLVGYENRAMTAEQFEDPSADAAELGADDQVTALYEITPASDFAWPRGGRADELASIRVRYVDVDRPATRELIVRPSATPRELDETTRDFRFAVAVAGFGLLLRGSGHAGDLNYASVRSLAEDALGSDFDGDRREFVALVERAQRLARD